MSVLMEYKECNKSNSFNSTALGRNTLIPSARIRLSVRAQFSFFQLKIT